MLGKRPDLHLGARFLRRIYALRCRLQRRQPHDRVHGLIAETVRILVHTLFLFRLDLELTTQQVENAIDIGTVKQDHSDSHEVLHFVQPAERGPCPLDLVA